MANVPTKTRVQVRGTIGKSVRLPGAVAGAGAVIGVNLMLPDGSIPTLAQLAADLQSAIVINQPGNISMPSGPGTVSWPTIVNVPPNVTYAPYSVADEDYDAAVVISGPRGAQGPQGATITLWPDDPDDPLSIPGPRGAQGPQGATITLWPDDPDDPLSIPGATGAQGLPGPVGEPGVPVWMVPDDAEDSSTISGQCGLRGPQGVAGVSIWVEQDDPEAVVIPGPMSHIGALTYFDGGLQISASGATGQVTTTIPLALYGASGQYAAFINNNTSTAGQSFGVVIRAGTNSSDEVLVIQNQASANMLLFAGNGQIVISAAASGTTLSVSGGAGNASVINSTNNGGGAAYVATLTTAGSGFAINSPAATTCNMFQFTQSGQSTWIEDVVATTNVLRFICGSQVVLVMDPLGNVTVEGSLTADQLAIGGAPISTGHLFAPPDADQGEDNQPVILAPPGRYSGSFTGTLTGCTTSPTGTINYTVDTVSGIVVLNFPTITGVSNTTACTITGLPAFLRPAANTYTPSADVENTTVVAGGAIQIAANSGTMTLLTLGAATFLSSGTKGILASTVTYALT